VFFSLLYFIIYGVILGAAFFSLTAVQSSVYQHPGLNPLFQLALYLSILLAVVVTHTILFSEIYFNLYNTDNRSFTASKSYSERRHADAIRELWLSKDSKGNAYFTNWILLDLHDYLNDRSSLEIFNKAYKLHYREVIDYDKLRDKLSKKYSDLLVRFTLRPPQLQDPSSHKEITLSDFPDVNELVDKISSRLNQHNVTLDNIDPGLDAIQKIRATIFSCYQELSDYVPISRFDVVLNIKSNEILSYLNVDEENKINVRNDIEKALFYHLSRRLLVRTDALAVKLIRRDFYFYTALSFFSASQGDIHAASFGSRVFSVMQVIATYVILVLSIAFLNSSVENIRTNLWEYIMPFLCKHLWRIVFISSILVTVAFAFTRLSHYCSHALNREILKLPENYGYTVNRSGTVDLIINLNSSDYGGQYLSSENGALVATLAMPYQPLPATNLRYPGILVTDRTSKIVWAEWLLPFMNKVYVYGDDYNINEIKGHYKILIPASMPVF
jgi:hypothetical protein